MSKKFNHLNIPSHWQSYWTRFPEGHTILEALIQWVSQVDEMVDNQNKLSDTVSNYGTRLDQFVDQFEGNLSEKVIDTLQEWQQSGFLDIVIDQALDTKYHEMDDRLTAQLTHTWKTLEHFPRIPPENDDTGRINRLIEATDRGETAYIPYYDEWLEVSDTIVIDKLINFVSKAKIGYTGSRSKPVFLLDTLTNVVFDIYRLADGNNASDDWEATISGYHGWENASYVGVEGVNLKWCTIKIYDLRNFYKGVRLRATEGKGYWFNYHYVKNIFNSLIGIEMNSDGTGSWFNANYFYDTSFGFNKSQKPFLEDIRTKYSIKQTTTNGNNSGGTSNYFYNLKFEDWESAGKHEGGLVQIYLDRMSDSIFEFRNEIEGESNRLAVMNLGVKTTGSGIIPYRQETNNILLIDHTTNPRYNKEIDYINTDEIYNTYPNVARLQGHNELKLVKSESSLYSKARKPTDTLLSVKGHVFTGLGSSDYDDIRDRVYGGAVGDGEITIPADSPLTITLKDIRKGDTFKIVPKGTNPSLRLRVYDKSNTTVDSYYINGVKTLASDFFFNENRNTLEGNYSSNIKNGVFNFTVNSEDVGSVRVLITGTFNGYDILSNSQTVTIDKTGDDRVKEQHYMNAKPSNTVNGLYEIGDMVYNTGTGYTDTAGWYLAHTENGLEWIAFS